MCPQILIVSDVGFHCVCLLCPPHKSQILFAFPSLEYVDVWPKYGRLPSFGTTPHLSQYDNQSVPQTLLC